jgi:hypothetical protein
VRVVIKIAGTAVVVVLLSCPWWAPQWGTGVLGEIAGQPMPLSLVVVATFLGLVALYCRMLHRTLTLVRPDARTAAPASVWWMFAIPYNFVEDFFIVHNVAASMAADASIPTRELRRWSALGYGWCALQILSLFPGAAGFSGSVLALTLWAAHWWMTVRINRRLADRTQPEPFAATR